MVDTFERAARGHSRSLISLVVVPMRTAAEETGGRPSMVASAKEACV